MTVTIKILETPAEIKAVENLQRLVWPGSETDVVPMHLLLTAAHNGGLVVGAFDRGKLVGFVFGFPGISMGPEGLQTRHCSHMLGVDPEYRDKGVGFALKRAQWQMVRHQGVELITWTYDPLQSRNGYLNIAKLGAICNRYLREYYGEMLDMMNVGLPSDRFKVELWVNSQRVTHRLSGRPRRRLDLAHYFQAGAEVLNPTQVNAQGLPVPPAEPDLPAISDENDPPMLLVEIPSDFMTLKTLDLSLASLWRDRSRTIFEALFAGGYLVTDFVYLTGKQPRSFYILSHGESTLGE